MSDATSSTSATPTTGYYDRRYTGCTHNVIVPLRQRGPATCPACSGLAVKVNNDRWRYDPPTPAAERAAASAPATAAPPAPTPDPDPAPRWDDRFYAG